MTYESSTTNFIVIDDGPQFYRWWQKPLYWWRVIVWQIEKRLTK